jgi:hypothetical protein
VGGCGEPARDLDPTVFFLSKRGIECQRCDECGIRSAACQEACGDGAIPNDFPAGCFPLVHDGTVCLRAITQSSCAAHRRAMGVPPLVPGECNFCPSAGD